MDFRYCLGMTASVSTLARSIGATSPSLRMNFSMSGLLESPHVHEMSRDGRRRRHRRADEVGARTRALPPLEIAVGCRRDAIARRSKIVVHAEAHRATGLPPLEAGVGKHPVEPLLLRLLLHEPGAGHDDGELDAGGDALALDHRSRGPQVLD